MIPRRTFIAGLGAAAAWPLAARGQRPGARLPRIGILAGTIKERRDAVLAGLQALGWIAGRTAQIELRTAGEDADLTRTRARELLELSPDVILVSGAVGAKAFLDFARTVPIVFVNVADPVAAGFVASLAHPGGNMTGFSNFEFPIGGKWVELLKEIAPSVARIGVVIDPENVNQARYLQAIASAAPSHAVEVTAIEVHNISEIQSGISAFASRSSGGLVLPSNAVTAAHAEAVIDLAARHRLPAIYAERDWSTQGGLMSYSPDVNEMLLQGTSYVDRILKGEKPADLPVVQPTKFELVINLKTAKALGLTIPLTLQYAADEVIE